MMKAPSALQRGMACLSCRKRKMKCDGARPVCSQCSKASRADECAYYEKKRTSRTQLLQAKLTKLQARLRELEAEQSTDSASSSSLSPQSDGQSLPLHQPHDYAFGFETSTLSTPELNNDFFLPSAEPFPGFDGDSLLSSLQDTPDLVGVPAWSGDEFGSINLMPPCGPSPSPNNLLHELAAGPSTNWWESDVLCKHKQILLDIFFMHRHQCAFDVHVGRFKASLLLPNAHKPHPSLVDAIYLLACYFSRSPSYAELETHFLKRSLRGIADALQHSDRIVHVLQASCLLALYFFWHGQTLEGYYHSSIAARLAVGLGLHQIRSSDWFEHHRTYHQEAPAPLKASVPLNPPADEVEYAERIAAFWQIFSVDRAWAAATGLPTALPDDDHPRSRIETIWPILIPDDPEPSLENGLIQPFPGSHLSGASDMAGFRVKAIALFERATRVGTAGKEDSRRTTEMSIAQLLADVQALGSPQYGVPYLASNIDLAAMKTLAHAATISLHRDGLEHSRDAYNKCIFAANEIVGVVQALTDQDFELMYPNVSTCWRLAAEVYLRVLATTPAQSQPGTVNIIHHHIKLLVGAMERLGVFFQISRVYATKIQDEWLGTRPNLLL